MVNAYKLPSLPVSQLKPLVMAIRALITGGVLVGAGLSTAQAELPVPTAAVILGTTPVDIAGGHASASMVTNGLNETLTVHQNQNDHVVNIDWQAFNISHGNSVVFQQPTDGIAINNIHDSNASQILGSLTANGQVYLINSNGFVFGKDSQVNVSSLVASSLGLTDESLKYGLVNAYNQANGAAALSGNGQVYLKDSNGNIVTDPNSHNPVLIQISVAAGAQITTSKGGLVLLAAPSVTNAGSISTPNGQTMLVGATDKVYLQDASTTSDIRGMVVEVGTGGNVTNAGNILASTGNVTLMGFAVNQQGIASATTSVQLNGSVRLIAEEGVQPWQANATSMVGSSTERTPAEIATLASLEGVPANQIPNQATVTLAGGSVTRVNLDNSATAIVAQSQPQSSIAISGNQVLVLDKALVQAHAGNVSINAVNNPDPNAAISPGDSQIYLAKGSTIDVSGLNVSLPASALVVQEKLQSNELRDSPTQRDGVLYGQKVLVDVRDISLNYTSKGILSGASIPLADMSGAVNSITSSIEQRSTEGGTINLSSNGNVVSQPGDTLNVSGGSVNYQPGNIQTTSLISNGQQYNIGTASSNLVYSGSQTVTSYMPGYVVGKAGGSLEISTYNALLEGNIQGNTVASTNRQSSAISASAALDQNVIFASNATGSRFQIDLNLTNAIGQNVVFEQNPINILLNPGDTLAANSPLTINTSQLNSSGISNFSLITPGSVTVNSDVKLQLPAYGSFNVTAENFDVEGDISVPSGTVSLAPINLASSISLTKSALIDVSGFWVNDNAPNNNSLLPVIPLNAGSVNLTASQGNITLASGSRILANGGAWEQSNGQLTAGTGGNIALKAVLATSSGGEGSLFLNGTLSASGLQQNGSLTLVSNEIDINANSINGAVYNVAQHTDNANLQALILTPAFFAQGGFANYNLTSDFYGLSVAESVQVNLQQSNLQLSPAAFYTAVSTDLKAISSTVTLPDYLSKPVNLSLAFSEVIQQNIQQALTIGNGASISTGAKGNITLNSDTSIDLYGDITAPGGNINATINVINANLDTGFFASQGIWLGANSQLSTAGEYIAQPSSNGLTTGQVLAGGNINITANRGYIIVPSDPVSSHSALDVSGSKGLVEYLQSGTGSVSQLQSTLVASNGGNINLTAAQGMVIDGNLQATAGGVGAAGGSLNVVLNRELINPSTLNGNNIANTFPDNFNQAQGVNIYHGRSIVVANDDSNFLSNNFSNTLANYSGLALLHSNLINAADFANINLQTDATTNNGNYSSSIAFIGDAQLNSAEQITLDSPNIQVAQANNGVVQLNANNQTQLLNGTGNITLNSAYVALGSTLSVTTASNLSNFTPAASTGTGSFTVNAGKDPSNTQGGIDLIGGLSFNGINQVNLNSQGDIRLRGDVISVLSNVPGVATQQYLGAVNIDGNLNLSATQVYPTTLTNYSINQTGDSHSAVTIQSNGKPLTPVYSAAANLSVNAENIYQQGVVEVPFGTLTLNATNTLELENQSITSVSGNNLNVLFGQIDAGNWVYPMSLTPGITSQLLSTPPEKALSLKGNSILDDVGSTINLKGGGNLYAYQFIPGSGGSNDVLNPTSTAYAQSYAIIPGVNNILTPYDPLESSSVNLPMGESVYLNAVTVAGQALAAGWYTLLPAHDALLPGAFLVTPEANTTAQYQVGVTSAGVTIDVGRYGVAGTIIANSLTQGFAIEPGSLFSSSSSPSQFTITTASAFYTAQAAANNTALPQLPWDAGSLAINALSNINLSGQLLATPANNGLAGQVDISGNQLVVVGQAQDLTTLGGNTVGLLASQLDSFNAPSLLLGGNRVKTTTGETITVSAASIDVLGDVSGKNNLSGQEILLAATNTVTVEKGAEITSTAANISTSGGNVQLINQKGGSDGAFLRISNAGQIEVDRSQTVTGSEGTLTIDKNASISANGSILLDSTLNTVFNGNLNSQGGSLALNASEISIGQVPSNTSGLVLNNANFNLNELILNSRSDINFYGAVNLNANTDIQLSAANINGFSSNADQVNLTANTITLANALATGSAIGTGNGQLTLQTNTLQLGSGNYAIAGFKTIIVNATDAVTGISNSTTAAGQLTLDANTTFNTALFNGVNGATTRINNTGYDLTLNSSGTVNSKIVNGLGVSWSIVADSIQNSSQFSLPSGVLNLTAETGDVDLQTGGKIDLSGQVVNFANTSQYSPAGQLSLIANHGNVNFYSMINLDGATVNNQQLSNAGSLKVYAGGAQANLGSFNWSGTILADGGITANNANIQSGNLQLTVNNLASDGFSGLNSKIISAGFSHDLSLELLSGDLSLVADKSNTINAQQFTLLVDQGKATIADTINVSGNTAGNVTIYGENGISLSGSILAQATGAGNAGGRVVLSTVHKNDTDSGLLDLSSSNGTINVSGGSNGQAGSIHLQTGLVGNSANITAINTNIVGANPLKTFVEATQVMTGVTDITSGLITNWQNQTDTLMSSISTLTGLTSANFNLVPGLDIRSNGDLTLDDNWDLTGWRYADASGNQTLPGFLTLQAVGNLNINANLSDGFATASIGTKTYNNVLQTGESWSYTLAAGGDVNLANVNTTSSQVMVRTGTGDINISAGGNILFNDPNNDVTLAPVVYTMGSPAPYTLAQLLAGQVPGFTNVSSQADLNSLNPSQLNALMRYGFLDATKLGATTTKNFLLAEYPSEGGNVNLTADGSITGVQTGQNISDWLVRSGAINSNTGAITQPTAWGINVYDNQTNRYFNDNVGALGGGNVTVQAGANINNLSVMLPTTGKPFGTLNGTSKWSSNGVQTNGGGNLQINAGNNIVGGQYYVGLGTATIQAGGSIKDTTNTDGSQIGAILYAADSQYGLTARQDLQIGSILNPTILSQTADGSSFPNIKTTNDTLLFTYSADSAASLTAIAGSIGLENNLANIESALNLANYHNSGIEYSVYPASLQVAALSGNINIDNAFTLFPSSQGQLSLLANGNIGADSNVGSNVYLNMADTAVNLLPNVNSTVSLLDTNGNTSATNVSVEELLQPDIPYPTAIHASIHQGDTHSPLIAANGNISFPSSALTTFYLPQAGDIIAGGNIDNLSFSGQNLSAQDVTLIQAGGTINFDAQLQSNGSVIANGQQFQLAGPGQFQILAGSNINLGASNGIRTIGNILNENLDNTGASINLLAGVSGKIDYSNFVKHYAQNASYSSFVKLYAQNASYSQLKDLTKLSDQELRPYLNVILNVLFQEIQKSASAAAAVPESQRASLYQQGFDAINALFPDSTYKGNLSLVYSQIQSLMGGDINLVVPGGQINVGLAGEQNGLSKSADQLGIISQQTGNINMLTKGDIDVNQSRVFTMQGGDITAWSSKGNIDAGRGAKSAISAPSPVTTISASGAIQTTFPPIISGSGIQAIGGGNIYLATPVGVVKAGEAGISGNNIVIAATAVIGAGNITASGSSVGVPVSVAASVSIAGTDSTAASVSKSAGQTGTGNDNDNNNSSSDKQKNVVSILSTDIIGFGACSVGDVKEGKSGCGG